VVWKNDPVFPTHDFPDQVGSKTGKTDRFSGFFTEKRMKEVRPLLSS
jgi:hypothetical protein|tara:strand:- start:205 stop:345 length:141 start_codon:yes stop_codon:yes gene_type:complete